MNDLTDIIGSQFTPKLCLMVYECKRGHESEYYMESHEVNEQGAIMAGRPLMQETIDGLIDTFFDERKNSVTITGVLPENLLSFQSLPGGKYKMVWYRPAEERVLLHKPQLKLPSAVKAWVPATLYSTDGRHLEVMALGSNARPTAATRLYRPPYFNVNDSGDVCLGTANRNKPERTYAGIMEYWEDLFWKSEATHENGGKKVKEGSLAEAWKKKIKTGEKWKQAELVSSKQTLKHYL